jgi:hypothetical protein
LTEAGQAAKKNLAQLTREGKLYVVLHKMRVPRMPMTRAELASKYDGKTARQWLVEISNGDLDVDSDLYPQARLVASRIVVEMDYRYVSIHGSMNIIFSPILVFWSGINGFAMVHHHYRDHSL